MVYWGMKVFRKNVKWKIYFRKIVKNVICIWEFCFGNIVIEKDVIGPDPARHFFFIEYQPYLPAESNKRNNRSKLKQFLDIS